MLSLEPPPRWAFSWCWFFVFASAVSGIAAILSLITLVLMFKTLLKTKQLGLISVYILTLTVQSLTAMVTFWMCRSSLKPATSATSATE